MKMLNSVLIEGVVTSKYENYITIKNDDTAVAVVLLEGIKTSINNNDRVRIVGKLSSLTQQIATLTIICDHIEVLKRSENTRLETE